MLQKSLYRKPISNFWAVVVNFTVSGAGVGQGPNLTPPRRVHITLTYLAYGGRISETPV